jgi:selenide,water dikinase
MGGSPIYALNIAEFPSEDLPLDILSRILEGGLSIVSKANIPILGGHTIKDSVPKYGLVVTGKVNKKNLTLNSTAKAGDMLILTKPIGTGIISTAIKKEKAHDSIIEEAVHVMTHLNKGAAEAMNDIGVNSCTDITGYGLLGHLLEMCKASNVSAIIDFNTLPLIQGAFELAQQDFIPGGTKKNLEFISRTSFSKNIAQEEQFLMADSQTSGGLLISVPLDKAKPLQNLLNENNCITNTIIGKIQNPSDFSIYVT